VHAGAHRPHAMAFPPPAHRQGPPRAVPPPPPAHPGVPRPAHAALQPPPLPLTLGPRYVFDVLADHRFQHEPIPLRRGAEPGPVPGPAQGQGQGPAAAAPAGVQQGQGHRPPRRSPDFVQRELELLFDDLV
jgi:hypothetical protein